MGATCLLAGSSQAADTEMLIIDTHQHLWDPEKIKMPWLDEAPDILRHKYYTAEYAAATKGLNIKCVYMEVDVAEKQLVDEAASVLALSKEGKTTIGAVIGGRPNAEDFGKYLDRFKGRPELKGVRRVLHVMETPQGYCLGKQFVKGVQLLGERGLRFDLCMRPSELADAVKLSEQCPDTKLILDHCGNGDPKAFHPKLAADEKPWHTVEEWKRGIEQLAKRPNVLCKISGIIARLPKGGTADDLAPIVNHCLDSFGPDRVVFGGDWPVCLLGGTLSGWVEMLTKIIAGRPAEDRKKLWSANAIKHYELKV
jgi:predicted TIM-barrel fold metal-dependent hydrolase